MCDWLCVFPFVCSPSACTCMKPLYQLYSIGVFWLSGMFEADLRTVNSPWINVIIHKDTKNPICQLNWWRISRADLHLVSESDKCYVDPIVENLKYLISSKLDPPKLEVLRVHARARALHTHTHTRPSLTLSQYMLVISTSVPRALAFLFTVRYHHEHEQIGTNSSITQPTSTVMDYVKWRPQGVIRARDNIMPDAYRWQSVYETSWLLQLNVLAQRSQCRVVLV